MTTADVLVLVHETDVELGMRKVGTLADGVADAGARIVVGTLIGPSGLLTEPPDPSGFRAVVVMGSPEGAADDEGLPWLAGELAYVRRAVEVGTPVLGVCFGGQLLARALGGSVGRAPLGEHGFVRVATAAPELVPTGPWMQFHADRFTLPPGARRLAWTDRAEQAFTVGPHLGVQFHPEITADVFDAWNEGNRASGVDAELAAAGIDVPAIRADIVERAEQARTACRELVARFLEADQPQK